MSDTLSSLVVEIKGDISDLQVQMNNGKDLVSQGTESMRAAVAKFGSDGSKDLGFFGDAAKIALGVFTGEAILHGLEAIGEAIKTHLVDTIKESIGASSEHEQSLARMNIALASAGHYSDEASKGMQEFAHQMMLATGTTETATFQAAALIENLTKLGTEGIKEATHAAIELSAITGHDLQSSAMALSRAIDGNSAGLKRMGIDLDLTGDKSQNLATIMQALRDKMTTAEGLTNTYSGALRLNSAAHEELYVAIGNIVTANQSVLNIINEVTKSYAGSTDDISKNTKAYQILVSEGILAAIHAMQLIITATRETTAIVAELWDAPDRAILTFTSLVQAASYAMVADFGRSAQQLKIAMDSAFGDPNKSAAVESLDKISKLVQEMEEAAQKGLGAIENGSNAAAKGLKNGQVEAKGFSTELKSLGDEGKKIYDDQQKQDLSAKYDKDVKSLQAAHTVGLLDTKKYIESVEQLNKDYVTNTQAANDEKLKSLRKLNKDMAEADSSKYADDIAANDAVIAQMKAHRDISHEAEIDDEAKVAQKKLEIQLALANGSAGIMGNLATVARAFGKDGFEFAKQASAAQAMVQTYASAVGAYESMVGIPVVGPALAAAAAGAAVAAGLANVATIESQHLATGLDTVPGIGFGDSFPAVLEPGEAVVDRGTNKDMKDFFAGGGSKAMLDGLAAIASRVDNLANAIMESPVNVMVGGKTIVQTIRSELRGGRQIVTT